MNESDQQTSYKTNRLKYRLGQVVIIAKEKRKSKQKDWKKR